MRSMDALDRIATAVATVSEMPTVMITVVRDGEQTLAAAHGLRACASEGQPAAPTALCRAVASGRPILMQDARRLQHGGDGEGATIAGYGGVPVLGDDRHVIGTLAAFGPLPRTWQDRDLVVLRSFADVAAVLLETRSLATRGVVRPSLPETSEPSRTVFLAQGNDLIARVRRTGIPGIVVVIELDGRDADHHRAREDLMRAALLVVRACFREHAVVGRLGGLQLGVVALGVAAIGVSTVVARLAAEMARSNSRRVPGLQLEWRVGVVAIGTSTHGDLARLLVAADQHQPRGDWTGYAHGTPEEIILPGELLQ
jgi:GAF domain-containing protein